MRWGGRRPYCSTRGHTAACLEVGESKNKAGEFDAFWRQSCLVSTSEFARFFSVGTLLTAPFDCFPDIVPIRWSLRGCLCTGGGTPTRPSEGFASKSPTPKIYVYLERKRHFGEKTAPIPVPIYRLQTDMYIYQLRRSRKRRALGLTCQSVRLGEEFASSSLKILRWSLVALASAAAPCSILAFAPATVPAVLRGAGACRSPALPPRVLLPLLGSFLFSNKASGSSHGLEVRAPFLPSPKPFPRPACS